jgi:HPt (histidine-containing phosphotransfer) domain-containing protein
MITATKLAPNRDGSFAFGQARIDEGVFDGLLDIIGAEALTEVLDSCRRQFDASHAVVAAVLASGDLDQLRHLAHDLKSSALNVGLTDLGGLAKEVETACRERRDAQALTLAQGLSERLTQASATLMALGSLH